MYYWLKAGYSAVIKRWFGSVILLGLLSACGGGGGEGSSDLPLNDPTQPLGDISVPGSELSELPRSDIRDVDALYVYRAQSPYADVLKRCTLIEQLEEACTLQTLPFITQAKSVFTHDDIMDRLLVTHDWMGQRFESFLQTAPEHLVSLFGSVTSIAIGSTVRPSFYWAANGGIRLDPSYLWLTVEEKATVSIAEDYRSDFGKDLQFWSIGSLRNGSESAYSSYSLGSYSERTLQDMEIPLTRLLYHELAHAVDFLPSNSVATLDASLTPAYALFENSQYFLSSALYSDLPLYSASLLELAQVSFFGDQASAQQKLYTPAVVGSEMAIDGAARYYAYASEREDFASLFALSMMKRDYGIDYYLAYVQKPEDESNYTCDELTVGWGMKNRLADPLVTVRAKNAMEGVYGSTQEIDNFFANELGSASTMTPGLDWCSNRDSTAKQYQPETIKGKAVAQSVVDVNKLQLEHELFNFRH